MNLNELYKILHEIKKLLILNFNFEKVDKQRTNLKSNLDPGKSII